MYFPNSHFFTNLFPLAQESLVVVVTLQFTHSTDGQCYIDSEPINLGLPLVSKLKLWRPVTDFEPKASVPI